MFTAVKIVCSCCFSLGANLDFTDFLQKKFYNIDSLALEKLRFLIYFLLDFLKGKELYLIIIVVVGGCSKQCDQIRRNSAALTTN